MVSNIEDDPEWPTFDSANSRLSYSPDSERENIFKDFKPKTEPKKKKKKKSKSLRLVSESEVFGNRQKRGRKKCIVVGVLVTCIVIIVAISVFLGVYFGAKGSSSGPPSLASSNGSIVVVSPLTTTKPPVHHTSPHTTPPIPPTTTIKPTPKPTTTTKKPTTTTTTTSTTTTTTTTTTPPPTEPPVRHYVETDEQLVRDIAEECGEITIRSTDRLSLEKKCRLYAAMMKCTYIRLIQQLIHVDMDTLGTLVEDNRRMIFSRWIEIEPTKCRDSDGQLKIANVSTLPTDLEGLCSSPDAIAYYWQYHCQLVQNTDYLTDETPADVCKLYWGTVGCVARHLGCSYSGVMDVVRTNFTTDLSQQLGLQSVNVTLCDGFYTELLTSFPCELDVYLSLTDISSNCSLILHQGSVIAQSDPDIPCRLLKVFRNCAYRLIEGDSYNMACVDMEHSSIALEVAKLAAKVAAKVNPSSPPFINTTQCEDTVLHSDVCIDSPVFVPVIDSMCYKKLLYSSPDTQCKWLSEYGGICAQTVVDTLNLSCTGKQTRNAILTQADMIKYSYNIEVDAACLVPVT